MSEKEAKCVPQNELERQEQFLRLIKEMHQGGLKKYNLQTFGCLMNVHDSEKLSGMLDFAGFVQSDSMKDSELVILNTCCIRENAEKKVYGIIGSLKLQKRLNPRMIIAVCGCMVQQPHVVEFILKKYKHVNLIFGTQNTYRLPELLHSALSKTQPVVDVSQATGPIAEDIHMKREDSFRAWINIIYGCNNFCSYCVVPYVRGRERSRRIEDILQEAENLAIEGYKEITLLGQNVNSYGKDLDPSEPFAKLLHKLDKISGLERIKFMTSNPKDLSDELIFAIRDLDKVVEHIHLPIQSGSNKVLKEMNRGYTREHYIDLIRKVKQHIPEISITTDIIVGFPGETDQDFEETLELIKEMEFDLAYTFLYSKRTGTKASESPFQVPEEVKKERFQRLSELQNEISLKLNRRLEGQTVEVLVEGPSKYCESALTGRTRTNKIVNFKCVREPSPGSLVNVKIIETKTWSLFGEII